MVIYLGVASAYFLPFAFSVGNTTVMPTVVGTLLIAMCAGSGRRLLRQNIKPFFTIFTFLFLWTIAAPELGNLWTERLQTTLQLVLSLLLATIVFGAFAKQARQSRSNFYRNILILILSLAAIEVFVPGVTETLDVIRDTIYTQRQAGSQLERDLLAYGALRPILLTPEPSYLAYGVGVMISLFLFASDDSRKTYITFCTLLIVATLLVRSPIVLLLPLAAYTTISFKRNAIKTVKGLIVALIVALIFLYAWTQVSVRPYEIAQGSDFSAFSRIFAPFYLLLEDFPARLGKFKYANKTNLSRCITQIVPNPTGPLQEIWIIPRKAD